MKLLPDSIIPPTIEHKNLTYLIYGPPGIGKTTFAAGLDTPVILDTEAGSSLQKVHRVPVPDWPTFLKVVDEIIAGNHGFQNIVIDTISRLVASCVRFCVDQLGITHPSDMGYGKAYQIIKENFDKPITKLQHSNYGFWCITHKTQKTIKVRGIEFEYTEPDLQGFMQKLVIPLCDFVLFADTEQVSKQDENGKTIITDIRVLRTKPTRNYMAKDRFNTRRLPETIPLDIKVFLEEFKSCVEAES